MAETGFTANAFWHTGLTAGSIRRYRVSAINSAGTGPTSPPPSPDRPSGTGILLGEQRQNGGIAIQFVLILISQRVTGRGRSDAGFPKLRSIDLPGINIKGIKVNARLEGPRVRLPDDFVQVDVGEKVLVAGVTVQTGSNPSEGHE